MTMSLRDLFDRRNRNALFIPLSIATSTLALRPDSTLIPVIFNLSVLLTYTPFIFRTDEPNRLLRVGSLGLAISVGSTICRIHASLDALSSKTQSLLVLLLLSSILSSISLATLWVATKRFSSSWSQLMLFPSLWATVWWAVSCISPVGYLLTWNVGDNADAYNWVVRYLGPASKNWIIGAWAVVLSQSITACFMAHTNHPEDGLDNDEVDQSNNIDSRNRKLLGAFLFLLTIPSFLIDPLPLPLYEIDKASPVTVGCVIPPYQQYKKHHPALEEYIIESNKLRSLGAKIILWPEGAVVFNNPKEKEDAFNAIRQKITGPYVGVSFEETISDPNDPVGQAALSRTGIAVISQHSEEPHLIYHKRNLVPFAESYRLRGSSTPPGLFDAKIPNPGHGITNPEWAPNGTHTRPIPVSASICLDFATPSPFADLDFRPGIILAPARTWDRTVGYAMWLQAKQRAEELNSIVLWCDGGEGGVSGIAGGKFNDVSQVGPGSFVRTIGIQYPFDTSRTPYACFGDFIVLLLWLPILGSFSKILPVMRNANKILFGQAKAIYRRLHGQTTAPLIDDLI